MNAVEIARKMETDAVDFYTKAAETTSHPVGKKIFLSIAEDERRHIRMIETIVKGMDITEENVDPMERVLNVFEQNKEQMKERMAATSDEKEAFKVAMEMEYEGREFYKKSAAEATDERSRALFERLALEEEKHYAIFSNTHTFLDDTGNWFMWEEHSIVEG